MTDASFAIVTDDRGRVLTVQRPEPPNEQALPGGEHEQGEDAVAAAIRETREETGIVISKARHIGDVKSPKDGRPVHMVRADAWSGEAFAAEGLPVKWLDTKAFLDQARTYRASVEELIARDWLPMRAKQTAAVDPTTIQTLIFDKDDFDEDEAKRWAKRHDMKSAGVDETEDSYRIRQRDPGEFKPQSFRTIPLATGVSAVVGKTKDTRSVRAFRQLPAEDVELDAMGCPMAFRIWKAGPNPTDHGTHVFTEKSARLLLTEQAERGNLYSVDVDHLSLNPQAPPEARKAVGWHRLEVRDGALWAIDVEWTDVARSGLAKEPPEWRYFSPAYDTDKSTGEIVSYLNTALTNNPATWSVTALAQRKGTQMPSYLETVGAAMFGEPDEKKEARAALEKMAEGDDADAKRAKAALAKITAGEDDADDADKKSAKAAEDDADKKAAADDDAPPPKKEEPDGDEPAKAAVAATRELAAKVNQQAKELADLQAERLAKQRAEILATRPDLSETLVKTLKTMPLELMRETIAGIEAPKKPAGGLGAQAAAGTVTATRGESRTGDATAVRATRQTTEEHTEMMQRFGRVEMNKPPYWERNDKVYPVIDRVSAAKVLASRGEVVVPAGRPHGSLVAANRDNVRHAATRAEGTGK